MKIRVPLDGSENAEGVLPSAIQLAKLPGVTTVLVGHCALGRSQDHLGSSGRPRVQVSGDRSRRIGEAGGASDRAALETKIQAQERLESQARDYLSAIAGKHFPTGAHMHVELGENVAENLIRIAKAEHSDLIVMATHGRSGLARMIMGSVTDRIMRSRVAPLVIIRPDHLVGSEA